MLSRRRRILKQAAARTPGCRVGIRMLGGFDWVAVKEFILNYHIMI